MVYETHIFMSVSSKYTSTQFLVGTRPCCSKFGVIYPRVNRISQQTSEHKYPGFLLFQFQWIWLARLLTWSGRFQGPWKYFWGSKSLQPVICWALSRSDSQHLIWHITVIVDAKGEIIYHDRVTWFHITLAQFKSRVPEYADHEWNHVLQKNLLGTICFGFNWQSGVWWLVIWCSCSCTHHIYLVWCGNRAIWGFRNSAHWIVHWSLWPWRGRILPPFLEGWWKDRVPRR